LTQKKDDTSAVAVAYWKTLASGISVLEAEGGATLIDPKWIANE
jgi:hypothetical protein